MGLWSDARESSGPFRAAARGADALEALARPLPHALDRVEMRGAARRAAEGRG